VTHVVSVVTLHVPSTNACTPGNDTRTPPVCSLCIPCPFPGVQICNAVAVAYYLNATLVQPTLMHHTSSKGNQHGDERYTAHTVHFCVQ